MKNTLLSFIFCLFVILANAGIHPIFAVTATPSATPTIEIQEKIKSLVKENLETTENLLQKELVAKSFLGFSGKVKSVGSKNLTLEIEKDILQVSIFPTTSITKGGSEIKTTSIALADKLIVIGTKNKDDVLEAKVINVVPEVDASTIVTTKAEIATIKSIDPKKKTLVLTINNKNISFTLSKKTTVKLEEFTEGDTILATTKLYQEKYSLSRAKKI